jgi:hypothetical protein
MDSRLTNDERRDRVHALIKRFNEIGVLLPRPEDLDVTDASAITDVRVLLCEMAETKRQIDTLFAEAAMTQ